MTDSRWMGYSQRKQHWENEDKALAYDLLVGDLRKLHKAWLEAADTEDTEGEFFLNSCAKALREVVDQYE